MSADLNAATAERRALCVGSAVAKGLTEAAAWLWDEAFFAGKVTVVRNASSAIADLGLEAGFDLLMASFGIENAVWGEP